MSFRYCLLAMLWPVVNCYSQSSSATIHPLTVGDTLPQDLVLAHIANYPDSQIRFADLRGKYVILDFWGKYCASCILALQKLDSLQQSSGDKVQVITISDFKNSDELNTALQRFKQIQNLQLPVMLGNEQLINYFPYTLVSHLIWIGNDGAIKAITGSEYITNPNIRDLLSGRPVNWPLKKDVIDFNYKKPLLDYAQSKDIQPQSVYYSALTTYMEGISAPYGTYIDSARSVAVTLFYNQSILNLVQLALDYNGGALQEQFTLHVKDKGRYIKGESLYYSEWEKENTYSYYAQLPMSLSKKEIENFLRADILRWLNILGIYAEKKTKYINGRAQTQYIITERPKSSA